MKTDRKLKLNFLIRKFRYRLTQRLILQKLLFFGAASLSFTNWISPPLALSWGMILALTVGNPFSHTSRRAAKSLLQACVVLLGFRTNLAVVLKAGAGGTLFSAGSIAITLLFGYFLGRWLKIPSKVSVLISAGTAICGGSAIAAVSSVIGALESEISVALGTVFLLNAAALYSFPLLGQALHLSSTEFGTWAGVAIHDISSVVGAALEFSTDTLDTATTVKLSRTLWIVPVSLLTAFIFQPRRVLENRQQRNSLQVPWFIGLFLLASLARTFVPGIIFWSPAFTHISELGLKLTLFLIGAGLSAQALRMVGWKPIVQGILLWLFISVSSLLVILQTSQ